MKIYDFAFIVDADPHADDFEDRFIEAGCDDATFILRRGAVALSFDRAADTYEGAVLSAYRQIRFTGTDIIRFDPDYLVSATDIADRSGVTRQAVGLYANGNRGEGFPHPVARNTTNSPLWDWVAVSDWFVKRGQMPATAYQEACVSRIINFGVQAAHLMPDTPFDIEAKLSQA